HVSIVALRTFPPYLFKPGHRFHVPVHLPAPEARDALPHRRSPPPTRRARADARADRRLLPRPALALELAFLALPSHHRRKHPPPRPHVRLPRPAGTAARWPPGRARASTGAAPAAWSSSERRTAAARRSGRPARPSPPRSCRSTAGARSRPCTSLYFRAAVL